MKPGWLLLALAACSTAKPTPPVDAVLQREDHAARASYSLERPAEAAASFRAALARAGCATTCRPSPTAATT